MTFWCFTPCRVQLQILPADTCQLDGAWSRHWTISHLYYTTVTNVFTTPSVVKYIRDSGGCKRWTIKVRSHLYYTPFQERSPRAIFFPPETMHTCACVITAMQVRHTWSRVAKLSLEVLVWRRAADSAGYVPEWRVLEWRQLLSIHKMIILSSVPCLCECVHLPFFFPFFFPVSNGGCMCEGPTEMESQPLGASLWREGCAYGRVKRCSGFIQINLEAL